MRVVIDSNIFIMCLNPFSKFNYIFTSLIAGSYTLCISNDISFEYAEIFSQKFQKTKVEMISKFFRESAHVVHTEVYYLWNLISSDPDDNKFVDCAVAANADYLVTNDKHFSILKEIGFPKVQCISIEEFLEILQNSQ